MSTTDSPAVRSRSTVRTLLTRAVPTAAATVLAGGLVLGAVGSANAAPAVHTAAAAKVVTLDSADRASSIQTTKKTGNLLHTTSFETRTWPWLGTRLVRQHLQGAPDGSYVARVSNTHGRMTIDDWPGEIGHSVKGATYTASMRFAAARWQSHFHPITLVVREHGLKGHLVTSKASTMLLAYGFKTLKVSFTAARSADVIDVYAYQGQVWPKSVFWADDASLTSSAPVITPAPPVTPPTPPTTPTPPTSGGTGPSTLGLLAYASGQPTALGDTSRYAYVVVQENQFSHIADIKRMNPNTKVLAYMNTSTDSRTNCSSNSGDAHLWGASFGVNYCYANRYHPDWFLKDRSGNRTHFSDYSFAMQMDPGNDAFANAWASGVYANAKHDGFDGIWIDDVNIDPGHGLNGRFAKYSDEQFGAATARWTSNVGDYLRSRGMSVIANAGLEPWVGYQLNDLLTMGKHITAVNREHYVRYGDICGSFGERFNNTATNGTPPLSSFIAETSKLQAQGTKITGVDYGYSTSTSDDVAAMTYGRALFLLSWDGTAGSAYFFRKCGVNDTAAPQWTASLGLPQGPIVTDSNGVMTRKFSNGMVVLNPNRGGSSAHVTVGTGMHTVSGASADGGVYVAPQTAAILSS